MTLSADLLQAVSAEEGGKIAIVIGAGCSFEAPTSLPLSKALSEDAHRRLVENGVLAEGDCADPSDLSKVADAVYAKEGSQEPLVAVLPLARFENAASNDGYDLAVALLREHAVSDVMTLNFDLGAQHALAGAGAEVGVIAGPEQMGAIGVVNLVHLHRDMHAAPDEWILRTEQIEEAWRDGWEQLIATRVMARPVVVFAGLGTAAAVLVDTLTRIRAAVADHVAYHVDPGPYGTSAFTDALRIPEERYVRLGWSDFMRELAQRLAVEHLAVLRQAAEALQGQRGLPEEALDCVLDVCAELDLVGLGELRARWLLRQDGYVPARAVDPALLADLIQGAAILARALDVRFVGAPDGCLQMRRGDRVVGVLIPASGAGIRQWTQYEPEVRNQSWVRSQGGGDQTVILAAGVLGNRDRIAAPPDIIDDPNLESVAQAPTEPLFIDVDELRANPSATLEGIR